MDYKNAGFGYFNRQGGAAGQKRGHSEVNTEKKDEEEESALQGMLKRKKKS